MSSPFINAYIELAVNKLVESYPAFFAGANKTEIKASLQDSLNSLIPSSVALNTLSPDYESIVLQLTNELSRDGVWKDFITAGVGSTLIRSVAAGIAFNQFSIERALQESFIHLASADNSIYAATEMLGVRINRVRPAEVKVTLTRTDKDTILELPRFTIFMIGDFKFFNRDIIVFPVDAYSVTVDLYQGELETISVTSNGQPFFEIELGDGNRDLSDTDVYVQVDGVSWRRYTTNPWTFQEDELCFYDSTTEQGNIRVTFGNSVFGAVPNINSTIEISFIRTLGEKGMLGSSDLEVVYSGPSVDTQITGVTETPTLYARDMTDAAFYAALAPHMRAANERGVRRSDYKSLAVLYPGVKDALFRGQAELGPKKRSMMNVIGVTLLTDSEFDDINWIKFSEYIIDKGIFQCELQRMDPIPVVVDVEADVYCSRKSSLSDIKNHLETKVRELFSPKLGHLGYSVYLSDISDILEATGEYGGIVEYVVLKSPASDTVLNSSTHYTKLGTLTLNMFYSNRDNYAGRLDLTNVANI